MRVLFWGTPEFATPPLRALLGEGFDVVGVVTQPDRPRGRSRTQLDASPRGFSGCSTGSPSASATCFTGDGSSCERLRPRGRSGCVTTPTTSKPSPSRARSGGVAKSGVPQKRMRIRRARALPRCAARPGPWR